MGKVTVAYYSTSMGVTQQQTGTPMVYYGKVFRIPKDLFGEDGEVDFQKEIEELTVEIQNKGMEPLLEDSTIERYEAWDAEGEDVWVMYRVPCQKEAS